MPYLNYDVISRKRVPVHSLVYIETSSHLGNVSTVVAEDDAAGQLSPFTLRDGRPIMREKKYQGRTL
jgi:hypothetical protein